MYRMSLITVIIRPNQYSVDKVFNDTIKIIFSEINAASYIC